MTAILSAKNLHKRFGALEVLRDINFAINEGEVVGLAGLSGSGKSVLAQIIGGLTQPTSGQLQFKDQIISSNFGELSDNIEVIHQHPILVDQLDVTTNIFLGHEILFPVIGRWLGIPNQPLMANIARSLMQDLLVQGDVLGKIVATLSSEHRQLVAIARAMAHQTPFVFIDEPTIVLSYTHQQKLLSLIQDWQKQGRTIIFSSTNLDHLFAVTDRMLVIRDGMIVSEYKTDDSSREEVVTAMIGQVKPERLTPVIWALDNYYQARDTANRLHQQTNVLEQDLVAQGTLNQQLVLQMTKQVEALDQANNALQDAHRRLLTEREQERKHLARELHDQVLQDLLSTNYQLESVESGLHYDDAQLDEIANIRQNIGKMIEDIRQICGDLRPPTIDSLGLFAAITSFTNVWSERTGITVDLQIGDRLGRLPEAIELSVFRIIQESLNNIARHADAKHVTVSLKDTTPRKLLISISDDGTGIPANFDLSALSQDGHYGLLGISERVALLSGRLRLHNREEGGLQLQVEIPHPRIKPEDNKF